MASQAGSGESAEKGAWLHAWQDPIAALNTHSP